MASGSWDFFGINLDQTWSSLSKGIVSLTKFFSQQQEGEVEKAPSQAGPILGPVSPRNSDSAAFEVAEPQGQSPEDDILYERTSGRSRVIPSLPPTANHLDQQLLDSQLVPTQQAPSNGGKVNIWIGFEPGLRANQKKVDLQSLRRVLERRSPPQEDEESSASIGPDKSPIQISSAPSAIIMPEDDVPSMPVGGKTPMPSLSEEVSNNDLKQGLRELSSEHLKELFNKFNQSQESNFMPHYGGLRGKDMFLNVAVDKIQSALRSPENGDKVKKALISLDLGYEEKAVEELAGLSVSDATKALISKPSKNELSDNDKERIKDGLKSSPELFQKLEDAGVYLLRDKPKDLDLAPQTRIQSSLIQSRFTRKLSRLVLSM